MIYPGEVETPILDARPVPVGADRRSSFFSPKTSPRPSNSWSSFTPAPVPELVITPTVDDFC